MSDAATKAAFRFSPTSIGPVPGADLVRERARAQGYAEGHAAGVRAAARDAAILREAVDARAAAESKMRQIEHEALLDALDAAVEAASSRTAPVIADAQATLFAAAVELASQIVGRELTAQNSAAVDALNRVTVADVGAQAIRMNPADIALVQPLAPTGVELVADETLGRGDAISEHPAGYLDATITNALHRAVAVLQEVAA